MAKFQKANRSALAPERAVVAPAEQAVSEAQEAALPVMAERPEAGPQNICGINGCQTVYDDPAIMKRHKMRQHGVGVENMNKPLPRHANPKWA